MGNKARVESSICNAYLTEEIANFCDAYFAPEVQTKSRELKRNACPDVKHVNDVNEPLPDVFSSNIGYAPSEGRKRFLNQQEFVAAHAYVLSNSDLLEKYERYVRLHAAMCMYMLHVTNYLVNTLNYLLKGNLKKTCAYHIHAHK